jgi:hypothetical protein
MCNFYLKTTSFSSRNAEEMKQLARKLSQQATFTASPSILAMSDNEICFNNMEALTLGITDMTLVLCHILILIGYNEFDMKIMIIGLICHFFYMICLPQIYLNYPGMFSFGEGCLVAQSCLIFAYRTCLAILDQTSTSSDQDLSAYSALSLILKSITLTLLVVSICPLLPRLKWINQLPQVFPIMVLTVTILVTAPFMNNVLNAQIISKIFKHFINHGQTSGILVILWICQFSTTLFLIR